jgi:hypothetical protein
MNHATMQQEHANHDITNTSTVLQAEVLTGELPVLGAGLAGDAVASAAASARTLALAPLAAAWVMACAKLPAFPAETQREGQVCLSSSICI